MLERKMLVIALCVLICVPSTKGISIEFANRSVDHWEFLIGASPNEFRYDFCKYNGTSNGVQCKNFHPEASVDFEKVCNCTIRQNETNEGSLSFDLNCKSNLSYCPKKLSLRSLTYEEVSYAKAPDQDVAKSGINGWLVVSIISMAVNALLITIILYLCKEKVHAFFNPKWNQLCSYSRRIYSRIMKMEQELKSDVDSVCLLDISEKINKFFEIACTNFENLNQIVSKGKSLEKPKGRADLGYFEDYYEEKESAHNVCVLVVRYDFVGFKEWQRDGDTEDVEALWKTFYENRNCHFRSLLSPRKDHLLQLLSDQDELLSLYDLTADDVPPVLVLVFLSHGKEGGKMLTDYWNVESDDYVHFTTKEVYDALAKLNKFETSLKLIMFCASFKFLEHPQQLCRGSDEETSRSESCQITSSQLNNTAVIFSTVDSASAPLDSTFVQRVCKTLDTIESDTTLLNALTMMVQRKVMNERTDFSADLTAAKAFFISKGKKKQPAVQSVSENDGKGSNRTENTTRVEIEPLDEAKQIGFLQIVAQENKQEIETRKNFEKTGIPGNPPQQNVQQTCNIKVPNNEKRRLDDTVASGSQQLNEQENQTRNVRTMEMEEILIEGEKQRPPTGPAILGFFQSESGKQNADNVFVLVVHYDFKNTKTFRNCDARDVEKLEKTFRKDRNCNFRSLYRPKKEIMFDLLGSQEKLLRFFSSKDIPSVFVLLFLSHGNENGVIYTDYWDKYEYKYISFTTEEVFDSLKKLHGFKNSLKLVNFGPCRGDLDDAKFNPQKYYNDNRNSCRITSAPEMPNTVIVYSTVETTSYRSGGLGSWFVNRLCHVLSQISEDQLLLLFLASVQHKIHKASLAETSFKTNLPLSQTPEVKMFSLDRSFFFSRALTASKSVSTTDLRMEKPATITSTSEFFSWKSDDGKNIRGRRAFIFFEQPTSEVQETEKALRQNLDFETRTWKLNIISLENCYKQVSNMEHDVGCIMTSIFGQVSENGTTREVCVLVDGREVPITDILHGFIGPKNDRLIGKPKIFFIVDQKALKCDSHSPAKSQFEVSSTNHSGWLVMILQNKHLLQQLIGIFKGDALKKGRSLQELLVPLLTTGSKKELTLLNSTLQYLIDFPDWPRTFVKPDFKLRGDNWQQTSFVDLIQDAKVLRENHEVWLLSSVAGAGKTTVLKEIAFQLRNSDKDAIILNISLMKNFHNINIFSTSQVDIVKFLANTTENSSGDITNWIAQKRVVVFLDGFDEVCPHSRDKVLKLLFALKERRVPLCVATRPHEAKVIEEAVKNAILVEIEPFDDAKQIEFLQSVTDKNDEEIQRIRHAVKQIDHSSSKYRDRSGDNILVNPLHLSLIAQCSGERNLFQIYDKVVRKTVQLCLERENGFEKVAEGRIEIALNLLRLIAFRYMNNEPLVGDGVTKEDLAKMNDFGVATVEQEKVTFIHQTFAEFLAAKQFLKNVEESGNFDFEFIGKRNMEEVSKFVDVFYSTIEKEKDFEFHAQIKVPQAISTKSGPFLIRVCQENLKHIFKVLKPHITFCDEQMENYSIFENDARELCCRKHRSTICVKYAIKLLVVSIKSEEIAIDLLKMNVIDSQTLEKYIDWVLKEIAFYNAISVFNQLKETFPNFKQLFPNPEESAICSVVKYEND